MLASDTLTGDGVGAGVEGLPVGVEEDEEDGDEGMVGNGSGSEVRQG